MQTLKPRLLAVMAGTVILVMSACNARLPDVTVGGIVISLPNADATQFSSQYDLSGKPADALKALENLVTEKKATSIANPAVTTKSGERAVSESGDTAILEVQPTVAKDGNTADVKLAITEQGHRIVSSILVQNAGVKFLGTFQNPKDNTRTDYIFVRVSF
jgi:hypothetical protein